MNSDDFFPSSLRSLRLLAVELASGDGVRWRLFQI